MVGRWRLMLLSCSDGLCIYDMVVCGALVLVGVVVAVVCQALLGCQGIQLAAASVLGGERNKL